ncbi:sodium-dependent transporter [Fangia hongkongensis]|uniref:sodium-dependent transporter n=1 Tax=Fangia hongkongensis TaxID=270495 RepID=UPI0003657E66|nr:sodium-dependent transporter [Fangia hongkongensis]MBK2125756.1 sodium-dependent transporter [Fangia hongkongensis]
MSEKRSNFGSAWIFILAAIGSAAGLGNLWRFPYLAYEHGGAAFFIAYIICLLCIGLPLLIVEVGLGKHTKKGAPEAMASVGKRGYFKVIGWLSVMVAFSILTYYIVIAAWTVNYATNAFSLPWQGGSESYFFNQFLAITTDIGSFSTPRLPIIAGVIIILLLTYICIYKGTSGLAFVAKWITPLPFILLIILLINSLSLSGSETGLHALFVPVWASLLDNKLWFDAASQVIFSISLATGVMFAYGALLDKKVNVAKTCTIVVIGDTIASVICGMIVFSVIGHVALIDGKSIHDVISGGIGLAFVVLPQALALLPTGQGIFSFIFYLSVFFLAFTSIISLIESVLAAFMDSKAKLKRASLLLVICLLLLIFNIIYTMGNGLYLLDVVDHYINGYFMLFVMILEALLIGWVYNIFRFNQTVFLSSNHKALKLLFALLVSVVVPLMLIILFVRQISSDITTAYGGYPSAYLTGIGIGIFAVVILASILFTKKY